MKRLFLIPAVFALFLALTYGASAQYAPTYYNRTLTATGVTTTAVNTRGYDTFVELPTDAASYERKTLILYFAKTTDSVKVQGKRDSTASGVSPWVDIPITYRKIATSLPGAGGYGGIRDTTAFWLTPVAGGIADYTGMTPGRTPMLELPPGFRSYRVVSGKNDSGAVYIQETLIPKR